MCGEISGTQPEDKFTCCWWQTGLIFSTSGSCILASGCHTLFLFFFVIFKDKCFFLSDVSFKSVSLSERLFLSRQTAALHPRGCAPAHPSSTVNNHGSEAVTGQRPHRDVCPTSLSVADSFLCDLSHFINSLTRHCGFDSKCCRADEDGPAFCLSVCFESEHRHVNRATKKTLFFCAVACFPAHTDRYIYIFILKVILFERHCWKHCLKGNFDFQPYNKSSAKS